jgi:hypothetical protein
MTDTHEISRTHGMGEFVDSIESLDLIARAQGSERYDIAEHSLEPFPGTKVSARAWGKVIYHQDGQVVIDRNTVERNSI